MSHPSQRLSAHRYVKKKRRDARCCPESSAPISTFTRPLSRPMMRPASPFSLMAAVIIALHILLAFLPQMAMAFLYPSGDYFIFLDLAILQANKELSFRPGVGKRSFGGLMKALENECNRIVEIGNSTLYSVMAKNSSQTPASGDLHDYYSLARYYWPDPSTPNGLPYKRLDGQVNPDVASVPDHTTFKLLISNIQTLSLGYFFLDEPAYAQETARIVRQWFIDPDTAMNPNLNYGSVVKGLFNDSGRNQGVLDFQYTYILFDSINLIGSYWQDSDDAALKRWFGKYLDWVWNEQLGSMEREMRNNHGTWYRVQVASIALYMNRTDIGAWIAQDMLTMINDQIDMSRGGLLSLEVTREASFYYSTYQLRAYFAASKILRNFGIDILAYQGPQGQSISAALDYLVPFALNNGTNWPFAKKYGFASTDLLSVLKDAVASKMETQIVGGTTYAQAIKLIQPSPATHNKARLWSPAGAFDMPDRSRGSSGFGYQCRNSVLLLTSLIVSFYFF